MSWLSAMLWAVPSADVQLSLAAANALLWFVFISGCTPLVKAAVRSRPWRAQWVQMHKQTAEKSLCISLPSDDAYYDLACGMVGVLVQHALGGALCLASAAGVSSELAFALARHGALCEMGWEAQDVLVRAWQCVFGGEAGRAKNPAGLLLVLCLHHMMGMSLVIPINLFYPRNQYVHEVVCLLQGAAAVALLMQNYGYTLDTSTPGGLLRMKLSVGCVWVVVLWSRVLRFTFLFFKLVPTIFADGNIVISSGAVIVVLAMSYINFIFFADATRKLLKFGRLTVSEGGKRISEAAVDAAGALAPTRTTPGIHRWASGDDGAPPIHRWGSSDEDQDRKSIAHKKKKRA